MMYSEDGWRMDSVRSPIRKCCVFCSEAILLMELGWEVGSAARVSKDVLRAVGSLVPWPILYFCEGVHRRRGFAYRKAQPGGDLKSSEMALWARYSIHSSTLLWCAAMYSMVVTLRDTKSKTWPCPGGERGVVGRCDNGLLQAVMGGCVCAHAVLRGHWCVCLVSTTYMSPKISKFRRFRRFLRFLRFFFNFPQFRRFLWVFLLCSISGLRSYVYRYTIILFHSIYGLRSSYSTVYEVYDQACRGTKRRGKDRCMCRRLQEFISVLPCMS